MPQIDLTRRLAELSALDFSEPELIKMNSDMADIIAIMDKAKEFVPESTGESIKTTDYNDLRTDEPCNTYEAIKSDSFAVPKTI